MFEDPDIAVAEGCRGAVALCLGACEMALLPAGALWWPGERLVAVGDLHLGRPERAARTGGGLIPPYGDEDTVARLEAVVLGLGARRVVCLGDSFDDSYAAAAVAGALATRLAALARGRDWLWIAGNHDPRAPALPGAWAEEVLVGPLRLRHVADPGAGPGEVSAHYHPRARLLHRGRRIARRCFLWDARRLILPAFGTYTGGLEASDPAFDRLLGADAMAGLLGPRVCALPRRALA